MNRTWLYTPLLLLGELLLLYLVAFAYAGLVACFDSRLPFTQPPWQAVACIIPAAVGALLIFRLFRRGLRLWTGGKD